ncbi:hypothetical protein GJ496_007363 [Pomphorhynchus laevis]|nr:hypothetical protein GJ496_007363 [Pomphorhynchus laevis]
MFMASLYAKTFRIDSEFREDTDSDATRLSEGPNETSYQTICLWEYDDVVMCLIQLLWQNFLNFCSEMEAVA